MLQRSVSLLLFVIFFLTITNAQTNPDPETIFSTGYDYYYNSGGRKIFDLHDLDGTGSKDPIGTGTLLFTETGTKKVVFAYNAFAISNYFSAFDSAMGEFNWGSIQYCEGGPLNENALIMAHHNGTTWHSIIDLIYFEPVQPFPQATFGGIYPQFVYLQDGRIIATTNDYNIYVSTDQGATWSVDRAIGEGDTSVDLSSAQGPDEVSIIKSKNNQTIAMFGTWQDAIVMGDTATVFYLYYSTDSGVTWNGKVIGKGDEYEQVTNRNYAPYFTLHKSGIVSEEGVIHIVCNGIGKGIFSGGTDTVNVYPLLYWNSSAEEWISISDEVMEGPDDGFGNNLIDYAPANSLGQSYPHIAITDNGVGLAVIWTGPEYITAPGFGAINIYQGDGGPNSRAVFYTDIYFTTSNGSGTNWGAGANGLCDGALEYRSETFPTILLKGLTHASSDFETTLIPYIFYSDSIPGSFIMGENGFMADSKWLLDYLAIIGDIWPSGVQEYSYPDVYFLYHNYPNPFNPTTKINYQISEISFVTLKVFDVLGKEVATLVNEEKTAGSYEVDFNAEGLTSGIYFYTLSAGSFNETKKMIILR